MNIHVNNIITLNDIIIVNHNRIDTYQSIICRIVSIHRHNSSITYKVQILCTDVEVEEITIRSYAHYSDSIFFIKKF